MRTKPHNSALAPLRVPIHGQSVPNTQTGKAWVRASPRPQLQPPCSHADKWMRARGKGAFLRSGSKALPPRPQRGSRWRNDVDISEHHKISVGLAFPGQTWRGETAEGRACCALLPCPAPSWQLHVHTEKEGRVSKQQPLDLKTRFWPQIKTSGKHYGCVNLGRSPAKPHRG